MDESKKKPIMIGAICSVPGGGGPDNLGDPS
jgi:hypothetical protein